MAKRNGIRVGGRLARTSIGVGRALAQATSPAATTAKAIGVLGLLGACVPGVSTREYIPPPDLPVPSGPRRAFGNPPDFGRLRVSDPAPPPISGGTLAALADGRTAVAADPDRDRVFVADYVQGQVLADFGLGRGEEPGRVIEDDAGRVHVALRRAGAILTLERAPWRIASRRPVCTAPRGLAFDRARNLLHVACAEGELVSLAPEPEAPIARRLTVDADLRDVLVDGDVLLVSRFRSAEVLTLDAQGRAIARHAPPDRPTSHFVAARDPRQGGGETRNARMVASVGWRMVGLRPGEAVLLHQRALDAEIAEEPGGYGSGCGGIVESVVSSVGPLAPTVAAASLGPLVALAVDVAVSPDRSRLVAVSPGNARNGTPQLHTIAVAALREPSSDCVRPPGIAGRGGNPNQGTGGSGGGSGPGAGGSGGTPDGGTDVELPEPIEYRQPTGEATAVAFTARGHLLVQTREPASIQVVSGGPTVLLSRESREDTGHAIFHSNSSAALACASCHPEATEDGLTWKFRNRQGLTEVRRTQNLTGSIAGTAPFHWNGDLPDLAALMKEVFINRMSGPSLEPDQLHTLGRWLDTVPAAPTLPPRDPEAVSRGRALFHSPTAACATCHEGPLLTNNKTVDVGTGKPLQVPTLRALKWRPPYMHDGCARTLADRFTPACGGGDRHGVTSHLDEAQLADLVAYMESL
jgi:hypothetical protein